MKAKLTALTVALAFSLPASAVQINFTGGTVVLHAGPNQTTNNAVLWNNVDYYEEGGFKLDFVTPNTDASNFIGNYYNAGNDVIHAHWAAGGIGQTTMIKVTKLDNTAFDLNYFVLTTNTDTGGAPANGTELAFIHASADGTNSSFSQQLPSENWGFPATQIFLGPQFDNIMAFWFSVTNDVDCFGMDNFFINEAAPGVPEPGTLAAMSLGLLGLLGMRRRSKRS